MIIYQISYKLGGLEVKVISTSGDAPLRARPSRGTRKSRRLRNFTKSSPYGWGFLVNPYLEIKFSQKFKYKSYIFYFDITMEIL